MCAASNTPAVGERYSQENPPPLFITKWREKVKRTCRESVKEERNTEWGKGQENERTPAAIFLLWRAQRKKMNMEDPPPTLTLFAPESSPSFCFILFLSLLTAFPFYAFATGFCCFPNTSALFYWTPHLYLTYSSASTVHHPAPCCSFASYIQTQFHFFPSWCWPVRLPFHITISLSFLLLLYTLFIYGLLPFLSCGYVAAGVSESAALPLELCPSHKIN